MKSKSTPSAEELQEFLKARDLLTDVKYLPGSLAFYMEVNKEDLEGAADRFNQAMAERISEYLE